MVIDIFGILFFLLLFCLLVVYFGIDFVKESYVLGEMFGDLGGLLYCWIIKVMILFFFIFMVISGVGLIIYLFNKVFNLCLMYVD